MSTAGRRAAFLDRDGTLIHDAHYLRDPALVQLIDGVPAALQRLHDAGFALVVVTNQSGLARGLITEQEYQAVRMRLDELLAAAGITIAASYHCPHEPTISGPCECRKPGTRLYRDAAAALGLDLAQSVFIGDRWRDVLPGLELGGRGILVPSVDTPADERALAKANIHAGVADSLGEAVALVVAEPHA